MNFAIPTIAWVIAGLAVLAVLFLMAVFARLYRKAGPQAVEGFRKVLLGIIAGDDDRRRFDRRAARG